MWNVAGLDKFGGLRDGYYIQSKKAIIMCDISNKNSIQNISKWYKSVRNVCGNIPIRILANKIDLPYYSNKSELLNLCSKSGFTNFTIGYISCKMQTNLSGIF